MHIIGGKLKGKKILGQKEGLRPTTAIAKSALFNILAESIQNKVFVDIFAGTGSVGFEAFSRGAKEIVFVELNSHAVKFLRKNSENLQINSRIIRRDVYDFLKSHDGPFDILFLSPPYDTIHWNMLIRAIENSTVINPETLIIVQHPKMVNVDSFVMEKLDERRYGLNKLTFFKKKKEA